MENAAKALQMAAGILFSVIIIAALVFAYSKISELKQTEEDVDAEQKATEFNGSYELFNRSGVYGSELLSLANKMDDYNLKQADEQGYQEISLSVTLTPPIGAQVYTSSSYDANSLTQCYNELSQKIRDANEKINGKNISYWAGSSSEVRRTFTNTTSPTYSEISEKIKNYNALVSERDDISRKIFNCTKVDYDENNGRIIKMYYEEP